MAGMSKKTNPDIKALIKELGGPVAVARHIGRSHGAVSQWTRVPAQYVSDLVELSILIGKPIAPERLRPDKPWQYIRRTDAKGRFN